MYDYTGWIVEAAAGRDKGGVFCVVGVDQERSMLLLADGKRRKVANPKVKKLGHVLPLTDMEHPFDHPTIQGLKRGTPLSDRALRRGKHAWRKMI